MSFNWCYYPLEGHGNSEGVQNPLPNFITQYGDPWASSPGWFAGDGSSTALACPWSEDPDGFAGVALPKDGAYLIGFQLDLGPLPVIPETILFCGYSRAGLVDGLRIVYKPSGKVRFAFENRNYADRVRETGVVSNSLINIFCYVDHRPAGIGIDAAYVHTYQNGTDVKNSSGGGSGSHLETIGDIYPQEFGSSALLMVGAVPNNGVPLADTHFASKIRRLHMMRFGSAADSDPSNLAELMGELSKAEMIPAQHILTLAGFSSPVMSRAFVQFT